MVPQPQTLVNTPRMRERLDYMYGLERFGVQPGVERMEEIMERLGHPERKFKAIHISGTNGKGSVAAMVDSVLREMSKDSSRRIGLYTSPHLYRFNERIQVGGKEITDEALGRHVDNLRALIEKHGIKATFFEFTTAIAMMHFAEAGVDVAIVEVGMGGFLDATNVVDPLVSVITNVGLDHTEYLGGTKEEVVREKAGIIKSGAPIVTGERDGKLLGIIREAAGAAGSDIYEVDQLVSPTLLSPADEEKLRGQSVAVTGVFTGNFQLPLLGAHQVENAACALSVLHVLRESGFDISWNDIRRGMARVRWEGRLDVVSRNPLVVVDGAHNNDGVEALYEFIKDWPRYDVLVLGEKRGKDMSRMAELVAPLFGRIIVTKGAYMAEDPGVIVKSLREGGYGGEIIEIGDAGEAVRQGREFLHAPLAGNDSGERVMLVAGSLYLAADALASLRG